MVQTFVIRIVFVACHLGLHCSPKSSFRSLSMQMVKGLLVKMFKLFYCCMIANSVDLNLIPRYFRLHFLLMYSACADLEVGTGGPDPPPLEKSPKLGLGSPNKSQSY